MWLCGPCPGRGSRTWVWRGQPQPRAGSPLPSLLLPRGLRSPECLLDGILQHCKPHESPSWSHILNFSDLGDFRDVSGSPVGLSDLQRGLWCSLDCGPGPSETGEGVVRGVCEPSVNVLKFAVVGAGDSSCQVFPSGSRITRVMSDSAGSLRPPGTVSRPICGFTFSEHFCDDVPLRQM